MITLKATVKPLEDAIMQVDDEHLCLHVFVSGKVQGVFFRAYTRDKALELGLTGWVRNLSDGRVEVMAEGPKEKLEQLLQWLKTKGSPLSRVEQVNYEWLKPTGTFKSFEIAPTL